MADYGITNEGFIIKPREQVVTDINTRLQTSFGSSFDVSPSSPDGQIIGTVADAVYEAWLREEAAFNNFVPNKSFGQGLDDLVSLNGVVRIQNKPTTVLCTLTGTAGTVVPAGSLVETVEGLQFSTNVTAILPNDVTVTCTTLGALPVAVNEVTVISQVDNPILGWTGVDNTEAGVTGIVRQTDAELRAYREANTISRGTSTANAIYQAVANLNLTHVFVDDNNTDAPVGGVPAHTVNVVADGGNRQEIAQAIFDNMPAGIPTFGAVSEDVPDSLGHLHTINFDRPSTVAMEVDAVVELSANAVSNALELAQQAVVDYVNKLNVGEDVTWSFIFAPLLSVAGVNVRTLTIGLKGGSQGTIDVPINSKSRAVTELADVTVRI